MPKYIFVTGGVMSGLGKGVTTASIAKLLQLASFKVTCIKIDPYLNVDAGTMNPLIHGEVFVTDDGGETDMDIGTYERFLNQNLTSEHNITAGQVYKRVIEEERKGTYLGRCVQIIPHVTDEIKRRIRTIAQKSSVDIVLVECGGTVGDIEGLPFLEALRQMRLEEGTSNTLFVHVTLAPILEPVGEQKTKPTQHSVQELRRIGIQPDMIIVRCKDYLSEESKRKISLFTSVEYDGVISNPDVSIVYEVPQILEKEGALSYICKKLQLNYKGIDWHDWNQFLNSFLNAKDEVKIAIVGKYVSLVDSYVSINHALIHAATSQGVRVRAEWIDSEELEHKPELLSILKDFHGILVPGGFGKRGIEGKIMAANYAYLHSIPYLGLCLGFQLAVVAFARYVVNLIGANSTEFDPLTPHPVIDLLPEQKNVKEMGATMRLGGHEITIKEGTNAFKIYGKKIIRERHRHRYELNQAYLETLENAGMIFSAYSDGGKRAEILEVPRHPFYFATQYHPEFISRPNAPEPIFVKFIQAAVQRKVDIQQPIALV
ncbi:MAG: CTP synthase [Nitrososphaerota archaeon]|nr:CTP synthase [Nitrososphaerales archaeon]MDW8044871.1 CTP synthase [Nitrososphaerota archaeon]